MTYSDYMPLSAMNFLASLMIPLPLVPLTTPKLSQCFAHTLKCLWLHEDGFTVQQAENSDIYGTKHTYYVLLSSIHTLKLLLQDKCWCWCYKFHSQSLDYKSC